MSTGEATLMTLSAAFTEVLLLLLLLSFGFGPPGVTAVRCYSCTGRTDDGQCGTPFDGRSVDACEGPACVVTRTLIPRKQAITDGQINPDCVSWTSSLDTVYTLGYVAEAVSTLVGCQTVCVNELSCIGVDWNPEGTLGRPMCAISLPSSQPESAAIIGITHFTITRSADCQAPCKPGPLFLATAGVGYRDALPSIIVRTLADCQTECIRSPSCNGVDWSVAGSISHTGSGSVQSATCRLVLVTSIDKVLPTDQQPMTSTTHYDIYRNYVCPSRAYEKIERTCSTTHRSDTGNCRLLTDVTNGIECACADVKFCNGDKDILLTADYQAARQSYGIVDKAPAPAVLGLDPLPNALMDSDTVTKKVYKFRQLYNGQKPSVKLQGSSVYVVVAGAAAVTWIQTAATVHHKI